MASWTLLEWIIYAALNILAYDSSVKFIRFVKEGGLLKDE